MKCSSLPPSSSSPIAVKSATPATSSSGLHPLEKKKTVARPLKYHEKPAFLRRESSFDVALGSCISNQQRPLPPPPAPWFLGKGVSESYRLVATIARLLERAALHTRPFSWGYGATDGALAHNNTQRVGTTKQIAFFRHQIVRSVSAGNRLSLFLTGKYRSSVPKRPTLSETRRLRHVGATGGAFRSGPGGDFNDKGQDRGDRNGPSRWEGSAGFGNGNLGISNVFALGTPFTTLEDLGRVYSWGTQQYGQLGFEAAAKEVAKGDPNENSNTDNQQGEDTRNSDTESEGEDGDDDDEMPKTPLPVVVVEKAPKLVPGLADLRITKISAGNHFVLAISSLGHVYSWGRGCYGQLGTGELPDTTTSDDCVAVPRRIDALADFIAVDASAGDSHSLGIFVSRKQLDDAPQAWNPVAVDYKMVYSWGCGQHGQLGLGGSQSEFHPREIRFFRGLNATQVAAGNDHSLVLCGVASQSFLYAFGGNRFGQLGVASTDDHIDMPSYVTEFANVRVASIGAGARYSVVLTGDGELFTWGDATYGKTHRSDERTTFVPWKMDESDDNNSSNNSSTGLQSNTKFVTQISIGAHHALGLFRVAWSDCAANEEDGEMDRWRKFPLGPTASYLHPNEGVHSSPQCICESSQSSTTSSFGIFFACETCHMKPICRLCARNCHVNHLLKPVVLGRREKSQSCACGKGAQNLPQTPVQQAQHQSQPLAAGSEAPGETQEDANKACAFAKLQARILEDEVLQFRSSSNPKRQ